MTYGPFRHPVIGAACTDPAVEPPSRPHGPPVKSSCRQRPAQAPTRPPTRDGACTAPVRCSWFAAKDCCIPRSLVRTVEDEKLLDMLFMELSSATYDFDENGRRVVERKKDQKKRLGFSPDLADGFLLTFAAGVFPREPERRWHDTYSDAGRTGWTG